VIGMQSFGASAPDKALYAHFGFGLDRIVGVVREMLAR
jgi:transketolase